MNKNKTKKNRNSSDWLRLLAVMLGFVALVLWLSNSPMEGSDSKTLTTESTTAPTSEQVNVWFPMHQTLRDKDSACWEVVGPDNRVLGFILASPPTKLEGFSGGTPMWVAVDSDLKLQGLKLLPNNETPGYLDRIQRSGFLEQWNQQSVVEALSRPLDAISGATLSSTCIGKTFRETLQYHSDKGNLNVSKTAVTTGPSWHVYLKVAATLWVLILAFWSFLKPQRMKPYRRILLALSVIILGFWQGQFLSLALILSWAQGHVALSAWILLLIAALSVGIPLLTRRSFYCAYLCPFGAAQELIGRVAPKWHIRLAARWTDVLNVFQRVYLAVIIVLLLLSAVHDFSVFEPFTAFIPASSNAIAMILAGSMLLVSFIIPRFWCRYLCPTGFILKQFR